MKVRRVALVVGLAVLTVSSLNAPAAANTTCAFDESTGTITVIFDQRATVKRSGDLILVKGQPCEGATVFNTDLIRFVAGKPDKNQDMKVDLLGGPFAPGLTDEGDGSSEIEFEVDTGIGGDGVLIAGTAGADHLVVGHLGANLNPDEAVEDLDFPRSGIALFGRSGDDVLENNGSPATGLPTTSFVRAGNGNDTFVAAGGTFGSGQYHGGDGYDLLDYAATSCGIETNPIGFNPTLGEVVEINGCDTPDGTRSLASGIEEMIGTPHDDRMTAPDTNDVYRGKGGDDTLLGKGGNDILDGGAGTDLCRGGDGVDVRIRCE